MIWSGMVLLVSTALTALAPVRAREAGSQAARTKAASTHAVESGAAGSGAARRRAIGRRAGRLGARRVRRQGTVVRFREDRARRQVLRSGVKTSYVRRAIAWKGDQIGRAHV